MSDTYPPLRVGQQWPFGHKHKGEYVEQVISEDPEYVRWCMSELGTELDNKAFEALVWAEENNAGYYQLPSERRYS